MLTYAVIFIIVGFFLGIIVKPKPAVRLCLYFSIGWAFVQGFWAIATFFELIFGMFLAASFIGKMRNLEEKETSSNLPKSIPPELVIPEYEETYPPQKDTDKENENAYNSDKNENYKKYEDYTLENFSYKNFLGDAVPVENLSKSKKFLELLNYILFIEVIRNIPNAKERITEIDDCFDLLSRISQLSNLSFNQLLSPEKNTLKEYIEELSKLPKNKLAVKNAISEDFTQFTNKLHNMLSLFLDDGYTISHFIYSEAITVSEESEEGEIFIQTYIKEDELASLDEEPRVKYYEEIEDYFHLILEQITDLDTRHKVQFAVIGSLMQELDFGIYQDDYEEDEEENESYEENENSDELPVEEDKEVYDFAYGDYVRGRKDPENMSEAEKFFELHYLSNVISLARNDHELQEGLLQSSMNIVTNIKSGIKANNFNKVLYRISDLTHKSLPELFDNNGRGFKKYQKEINSDKAIKKAVTQLLKEKGEKELADKIAELLNQHIENKATAREFILQELDAMSYGNDTAQDFINQSGFSKDEYKGTMNNSSWENNDTISQLQQYFRMFTLKIDNLNTMFNVNLMIVDYIMKYWKLGKYENTDNILSDDMDEAPF